MVNVYTIRYIDLNNYIKYVEYITMIYIITGNKIVYLMLNWKP